MNIRLIEIKHLNGFNELECTDYTLQKKNIFGKWKPLKIKILNRDSIYPTFEYCSVIFKNLEEAEVVYELYRTDGYKFKEEGMGITIKMGFLKSSNSIKPIYHIGDICFSAVEDVKNYIGKYKYTKQIKQLKP